MKTLLIGLLIGISSLAVAQDTVVVGGMVFHCDNQCIVTVGPNGNISVRDSQGGRVRGSFQVPPGDH